MPLERAALAGAGVLAGAYRGKDIGKRTLLTHAVPIRDIASGKLRRKAGEALCDRKLSDATNLVDEGGWVNVAEVTCPKCLDVMLSHGTW